MLVLRRRSVTAIASVALAVPVGVTVSARLTEARRPAALTVADAPADASADPQQSSDPKPPNPTDEERRAGVVELRRSHFGARILPPPSGAAPAVSRAQAWAVLRRELPGPLPGADDGADESWVLLADYSADHPALDPDMDGQDMTPVYQQRLVWVVFQFGVRTAYVPRSGGPFCPELSGPCVRRTPGDSSLVDVIAAVDAATGESIGATMAVGP